jgi:hypothetical protein
MKRLLSIIAGIAVSVTASFAQKADYEPTTTWPYIYSDFVEGEASMNPTGTKTAKFNICLINNAVHFIDGELVKEALPGDILSVKIGDDIYQNVNGEFLKVVALSDKSAVVEAQEIDMSALNATGGAYGSSSNTLSTMALSSLEGIGATNSSQSLNHMDLLNNKEQGKILTLIKKNYLVAKGYKVFCNTKDFLAVPGIDKAAAKTFLKQNKIKWKNPQSALLAGDYLADQL